jgi:translation initiation factor IF-3
MAHQSVGMAVLEKMTEALKDIAMLETEPKREGRQVFCLYAPDPLKIKDYTKKQAQLKKEALKLEKAQAAENAEATEPAKS